MKRPPLIVSVACIAALAFCLPITASAQSKKFASPAPAESASPAATTSDTAAAKPLRAIPLTGIVSAVDADAKTFTIAGKKTSRVFRVTDKTTVTKDGAAATFADIAAEEKVSGSYWKTRGRHARGEDSEDRRRRGEVDERQEVGKGGRGTADESASPTPSSKK